MKKVLTSILIVLLVAGFAYAAGKDWVRHSATSDAQANAIVANPGALSYVIFFTDGSTPNTVNIYDFGTNNGFASTTELNLIPADYPLTTSATDRAQKLNFDPPVRFEYGLYIVLASTSTEYMFYYNLDHD